MRDRPVYGYTEMDQEISRFLVRPGSLVSPIELFVLVAKRIIDVHQGRLRSRQPLDIEDCKLADGSAERFNCPPTTLAWVNATALFDTAKVCVSPIELTENLYYTGSAGDIVDSMEMSCRMEGKVARLLVGSDIFF
jgi:hypothetical protein